KTLINPLGVNKIKCEQLSSRITTLDLSSLSLRHEEPTRKNLRPSKTDNNPFAFSFLLICKALSKSFLFTKQ
ncbi:hypothetical protein KKH00_02385, partial [Patescibacteria group bacterium]|nr:hypothetical protein [Patescibacteria group bacterium]